MQSGNFLKSYRLWLAAIVAVAAVLFVLAPGSGLQAAPAAPAPAVLEQSQLFNDGLEVESGQTIEGDVVVYQGDVTVKGGGAILGSLVAYSGDIEVEAGGRIDGDISAFSGDVKIAGRVTGSISAWSGDVRLENGAFVGGDISVVSGAIEQETGATVEGNILRGPNLKLELPSIVPGIELAPPVPPRPQSFVDRGFELFWRVVRAILLLGVAVVGSGALMYWRPALVADTRNRLLEQTALSFAIGLLVNMFALAIIVILWITVCFRPPAVLLGIALMGLNLAGLAPVGDEIGRRIGARFGENWKSDLRTGVGIVVPGAILAFLWILGGCFTFFAFLGTVLLTSFGAGAMVVKLLNLGAPQPTPEEEQIAAIEGEVSAEPAAAPAPAQPVAEAPAQPVAEAPAAPAGEDDFTRIAGIGPVFDQRLKDAGIRTFADLASRTAAELADIIRWPVARVERSELREQARRLAEES